MERLRRDTQDGRVVELDGRRKTGATFPVELSIGSWSLGGKAHVTCILRDITQRQELMRPDRVTTAQPKLDKSAL